MRAAGLKWLCALVAAATAVGAVGASTACGYFGPIAQEIENGFDKCYTEHVKESRLRMAVGFEHCFGATYDKLNATVGSPYEKKRGDTQATVLHLAEAVCSDNEDALNEFILGGEGGWGAGDDGASDRIDPSDFNLNQCREFFDAVLGALSADNFQVASLMKANEKKLAGQFPEEHTRAKVFLVVVNVIKPMAACHQPMLELRMRLIKKYLKRFLMDQISPSVPSFSGKTLPVVSHPELFVTFQSVTQAKPLPQKEFDWNAKRVRAVVVAPQRVVKLEPRAGPKLSESQKQKVIAFDLKNADKPLDQRDKELMQSARAGKITDTQFMAMTPQQRLAAGLLTRRDYVDQVVVGEQHGHYSAPVEIDDLWDPSVNLKTAKFKDADFDRYRIKGFDIDSKIDQLFNRE